MKSINTYLFNIMRYFFTMKMSCQSLLCTLLLLFFFRGVSACDSQSFGNAVQASVAPKHFAIITAAYNNAPWVEQYLEAIFCQDYSRWRLIYTDDCSTDGALEILEGWLARRHNGFLEAESSIAGSCECAGHGYCVYDRVVLVKNTERVGHVSNQYDAIHSCDDHEICVIVDGDDFLADEGVLSFLAQVYEGDVWLTYGQYRHLRSRAPGIARKMPASVLEQGTIRLHKPWSVSHLRTFYAGLYKRIKREDLCYEGAYLPMVADVATMIPMIEMARERVKFIKRVLLVYNDTNPLSFFRKSLKKQLGLEKYIRSLPRYERLKSL